MVAPSFKLLIQWMHSMSSPIPPRSTARGLALAEEEP